MSKIIQFMKGKKGKFHGQGTTNLLGKGNKIFLYKKCESFLFLQENNF